MYRSNKRSVPCRQCSDNIKYKKVGVLPMQIVKLDISSVGPSPERNVSYSLFKVHFSFSVL